MSFVKILSFLIGLLFVKETEQVSQQRHAHLTSPDYYVIFGGDLDLAYSLPHDVISSSTRPLVVEMSSSERNFMQLLTLPIPFFRSEGRLTVNCGLIDRPGHYTFRLIKEPGASNRLAQSNTLIARWPEVQMTSKVRLTGDQNTLTVDVVLNASVACDPLSYTLELVYYGSNLLSTYNHTSPLHVVYTSRFYKLYHSNSISFTLPCNSKIVPSGFYRIRLRSATNHVIKISDQIRIEETDGFYSLQVSRVSQSTGGNVLTVQYTRPSCKGSNRDKIRLYRRVYRTVGVVASPFDLQYIGEMRTSDEHKDEVNFTCEDDSISESDDYCLKYISVSHSNGAIQEKCSLCVSKHQSIVDGQWSPWSRWSTCSATCGESGKQMRNRICDQPAPSVGGRMCNGKNFELRVCNYTKDLCSGALYENQVLELYYDEYYDDPVNVSCLCGCRLTSLQTPTRVVIKTTESCTSSLNQWFINTDEDKVIEMTFQLFDLHRNNDHGVWLKIRDGDLPTSNLLFLTDGRPPYNQKRISTFTSSHNRVLIQTWSRKGESINFGIILVKSTRNENRPTEYRSPTSFDGQTDESTISIFGYVGISICILLSSSIAVFIWRYLPNVNKHHLENVDNNEQRGQVAKVTVTTIPAMIIDESNSVCLREITPSETYSEVCLRNSTRSRPILQREVDILSPTIRAKTVVDSSATTAAAAAARPAVDIFKIDLLKNTDRSVDLYKDINLNM